MSEYYTNGICNMDDELDALDISDLATFAQEGQDLIDARYEDAFDMMEERASLDRIRNKVANAKRAWS